MAIELFERPSSAPTRAIKTLAKRIGLELKLTPVNLADKEHLEPKYLAMFPFHTVPALNDNGFHLSESRAILVYLVSKYAPESDLLPKGIEQRAQLDAMMHFDNSILSAGAIRRLYSYMNTGKDLPQEDIEKCKDSLKSLDNALSTRKYTVGDHLTVADISIIHTLFYFQILGDDMTSYVNLKEYMNRIEEDLGQDFVEENNITILGTKEKLGIIRSSQ